MIGILIAAAIALIVSILFTPYLIRVFSRQGFGQEIREEGPEGHKSKRGTPTMGGVAILVAMWAGYLVAHLFNAMSDPKGEAPTASGLLVMFLTTGLGVVGFLDDFIKIRKQRNLGLNKTAKMVGQLVVAVVFGVLAMNFADEYGFTPASIQLSFVRDLAIISFGTIGFVVFCYIAVSGWSNAVNFTDGLDGLAGGSSAMVFGTYVVITFWQFRYNCGADGTHGRLLRRARSARPGGGRRRRDGRLHRLPVVERGAGEDLHGRHRLARARRPGRRPVDHHPHRAADGDRRRAVRRRDAVGGHADRRVPDVAATIVPHGAVPSSLRARRVGGNHGDHQILAAGRDLRDVRPRPVLQRVAHRLGG